MPALENDEHDALEADAEISLCSAACPYEEMTEEQYDSGVSRPTTTLVILLVYFEVHEVSLAYSDENCPSVKQISG